MYTLLIECGKVLEKPFTRSFRRLITATRPRPHVTIMVRVYPNIYKWLTYFVSIGVVQNAVSLVTSVLVLLESNTREIILYLSGVRLISA